MSGVRSRPDDREHPRLALCTGGYSPAGLPASPVNLFAPADSVMKPWERIRRGRASRDCCFVISGELTPVLVPDHM